MDGKSIETVGAELNQQGQTTEVQTDANPTTPKASATIEKITLTKDELDKKLQAEADKRVTSALKTAQVKWEEDYEKRLKVEKEEAEKLAKLSEEEKRKVLDERRTKELEDRERKIFRKELEIAAIKILDGKKLPVKFASLLLGDDADQTHSNIEAFEKEYHGAIESAVNERMKGFTPKNATPAGKNVTMNDIIRSASRK